MPDIGHYNFTSRFKELVVFDVSGNENCAPALIASFRRNEPAPPQSATLETGFCRSGECRMTGMEKLFLRSSKKPFLPLVEEESR